MVRTTSFKGQCTRNQFIFAAILVFLIIISLWSNHDRLLQKHEVAKVKENKPKYAFATLLVNSPNNKDQEEEADWSQDYYFMGTRILTYQLLHHPGTRSKTNIPFLVGVSQNYSSAKQERLRKDGATVIEIESISSDWIKPNRPSYSVVLTKLRFWELEEYDRICIIDGDIMLTRPIDGVFNDSAVRLQTTGKMRDDGSYKEDEGPLPNSYAFASNPETSTEHNFPPTPERNDYPHYDYLNAGFMVFRPDKRLFNHYMKILAIPERFDSGFPEQNLLNYAHKQDGYMPWRTLGNRWNINFPTMADVQGGVGSVHEKFWAPFHEEMGPWLRTWKDRMEGYFEAKDEEELQ